MSGNTRRVQLADLDCRCAGDPEADSVIICLHGIGGGDASFDTQLTALADEHHLVAWNMPGYRQSRPLPSLSFETLSDALKGLVEALGAKRLHLLGHSIGGMIAQDFAHRYPGVPASLILVATTSAFGGRDDTFKQQFLEARLTPLERGLGMAGIARQAMPSIVAKGTSAEIINAAADVMAGIDPNAYADVLRCLVTFDRRTDWASLDTPVFLVSGSEDTNAPASTMLKMANRLAGARYHEITGVGHLVHNEASDEFNRVVRGFLHNVNQSRPK